MHRFKITIKIYSGLQKSYFKQLFYNFLYLRGIFLQYRYNSRCHRSHGLIKHRSLFLFGREYAAARIDMRKKQEQETGYQQSLGNTENSPGQPVNNAEANGFNHPGQEPAQQEHQNHHDNKGNNIGDEGKVAAFQPQVALQPGCSKLRKMCGRIKTQHQPGQRGDTYQETIGETLKGKV